MDTPPNRVTFVERVLLKTFQNRRVSSPAPVTMASPSGDMAYRRDRRALAIFQLQQAASGTQAEARQVAGDTQGSCGAWPNPRIPTLGRTEPSTAAARGHWNSCSKEALCPVE